jgi:hypothetical protein
LEDLKIRCQSEDNYKMDIEEIKWRMWIGFMRLRIGTSGGLL